MNIKPANIDFNQQGTPIALAFDDVYFSNQNGLEESLYVFIHNNHLPHRWSTHPIPNFTVAETGFGTGLNFLVCWQQFIAHAKPHHRLHFISTEKYPLTQQDLQQALAQWPELSDFSNQLIVSYPDIIEGCHRLLFADGRVILDLHLGEASQIFSDLHNQETGLVDAWFLDGFAPSKNPQMWTTALFQQVARLSKVGATFATFTAAGMVKRGLADCGFSVKKVKGFGRKREMLVGELTQTSLDRRTQRYFQRNSLNTIKATDQPLQIGIIGGGIAAANLALSLVQKGIHVTLLCKDNSLALGASGNIQGGFYPQLNAEANIASRVQALSFGFAARRYQQILESGSYFSHQWCGVLQLAFNENVAKRQHIMMQNAIWPDSLVRATDEQQSTDIAGISVPYSGVYIPRGGWICPPELVQATIAYAQKLGNCEIVLNAQVQQLETNSNRWLIKWDDRTVEFDAVVIATGAETGQFEQCHQLPFQLVRGQVESLPSQAALATLKTVLCHKGYLTPEFKGQHALGSTYVKTDTSRAYRKQEQETNLQTHQKALAKADWAKTLVVKGQGRAAIRCSLPDHLPVAGALFDAEVQTKQFRDLYKALRLERYDNAIDAPNLYILAGLGSRGLTTAPLMAEIVASQIVGDALPLDNQLLAALNPNRYLIKDLIRRRST